LGYFFVLSDQLDKLHNAQQQEEQLKQTFVDKKRQAINLEALQQQLKEIQLSFGALLKQLPTKAEMDALLTEINQAGIGRGLQFDLFRPSGEVKTAEMAEVPIAIRLTGSYNDLAAFVSDVAQLAHCHHRRYQTDPGSGQGCRTHDHGSHGQDLSVAGAGRAHRSGTAAEEVSVTSC
jgi:type IV pilus assembly protein PilO